MTKRTKIITALAVLLLAIASFNLFMPASNMIIVSVEVVQPPYKMAYTAGVDDSLDMAGCVIRFTTRDGVSTDIPFESSDFVTVRYQIDFSRLGNHIVTFYRGDTRIHSMVIRIVAPE